MANGELTSAQATGTHDIDVQTNIYDRLITVDLSAKTIDGWLWIDISADNETIEILQFSALCEERGLRQIMLSDVSAIPLSRSWCNATVATNLHFAVS